MSTLASQKQLADLNNKFEGRLPIRVHFLDNSSKVFLISEYASMNDLLTVCLEKLSIAEASTVLPYFAIFESRNGSSIDGHLPLDTQISDVIRNWSDLKVDKTAKFLFMIRLYLPSLWGLTFKDIVAQQLQIPQADLSTAYYLEHAELTDPNILHVQFIQAVYHVITGKYPTTQDEALTLGAYHFLAKFGEYKSDRHVPGFLGNRIAEFVPIKLLKGTKTASLSLEEWEQKLYGRVVEVSELIVVQSNKVDNIDTLFIRKENGTLVTLTRQYMEMIYGIDQYGVTFFKAQQKSSRVLPDSLVLGIYYEGLYIMDKNKKVLRKYYIEDILRWGFKPNQSFFFELPPDLNDLGASNVEFDTVEGKVISDLLTDYALAFLKEKEREEARESIPVPPISTKNSSPARPPSAPTPTKGKAAGPDRLAKAAVKVQALWRGYSLRNEWVREDAAILIQSIFRGYKARLLLSAIIEQMINDGEL